METYTFKAFYQNLKQKLALGYGRQYEFNVKPALLGRGFSIQIKDIGTLQYDSMESFIADWREIELNQ